MFGGEPTLENAAYLCSACHKIKTKADQAARKTRNKHAPRKDRPKSGWFSGQTKKLPTRKMNQPYTPNTKQLDETYDPSTEPEDKRIND